ncbi:HAMP domain-containing histidine kinase [Candidatus Sumerlaeota bacterium]|nr:HAMP domain-containing histidine kinase [Candidatus Sumerlaeota bacterium]
MGQGIAGWVAEHGEPLILQGDLKEDPRFAEAVRRSEISSAISVPLFFRGTVIGVLNLAKGPGASPFTESDVEFTSVLAGQAAAAIENARMFERIQKAYQQLAELDYLKSEFISIAAHELRTPLAIILAYSTLMKEEATEAIQEHLDIVVDAAMQLKSVIENMVDLSHLESGELELQPQPVRFSEIVELVLEGIRPLAEEKEHTISTEIPPDLPTIVADKQKLCVILSNLLSNAIKFTETGGQISIRAEVDGDALLVAVTDNGIGIPEKEQERIFDRFYQVESSLRREHKGIGLGLSIAKGMVELHGGTIWVESQPGSGSTFYFRIPLRSPR